MIRGTTPTIRYNLPFQSSLIKSAEIVLEYVDANKKVLIEKKTEDCTLQGNSIQAVLTQEETLQIPAPSIVEIQLRVVTTDGTIMATVPEKVAVKRLLKEDVIE
jgi:hypothetical protein